MCIQRRVSILVVLIIVLLLSGLAFSSQTEAALYGFDMNTASSPTHDSYNPVTPDLIYNSSRGYGWEVATIDGGRDRGGFSNPLSDLVRDFHYGYDPTTFMVDLPNGTYTVTLYFYVGNLYSKDAIQVQAEGNWIYSVGSGDAIDVPANGTIVKKSFTVTVADEQLNLTFSDGHISTSGDNWIINAIEIVPIPASALLLGSGLMGLGLLGWRRKRS